MQTKVNYVRGYKYIKPKNKRGYYLFTDFKPFNKSLTDFMLEYKSGLQMSDGYNYEPFQQINLSDNVTQMIKI